MIGFVMLAGIIVNNGIVLIDYVNQLRAQGVSKFEALVEAGITRLRPILMTTLTTVLGLSTMAMGMGTGAQIDAAGSHCLHWRTFIRHVDDFVCCPRYVRYYEQKRNSHYSRRRAAAR